MLSVRMSVTMNTLQMQRPLATPPGVPLIIRNSCPPRHLTVHLFNFELSFNHACFNDEPNSKLAKFNGIRHGDVRRGIVNSVYIFIVIFIDG